MLSLYGCAVAIILATLSAFPSVSAQTPRGSVSGVVRGSLGNGLVAARVTASDEVSGVTRSATTIQGGAYTLTGLAAGTYTVSVMQLGFRPASRTGVQITFDIKPARSESPFFGLSRRGSGKLFTSFRNNVAPPHSISAGLACHVR